MPWNKTNCPDALQALRPSLREKAIEIANTLYMEGLSEQTSIAIAAAKAKKLASQKTVRRPN